MIDSSEGRAQLAALARRTQPPPPLPLPASSPSAPPAGGRSVKQVAARLSVSWPRRFLRLLLRDQFESRKQLARTPIGWRAKNVDRRAAERFAAPAATGAPGEATPQPQPADR